MCAQSQLVVNATDGSQTKISLDKKPLITFGLYGEKVKITYDGKTEEIDVKDLKFEGVEKGSNEMVVINGQMIPLDGLKSIVLKPFDEAGDHLANVIARDPKVSLYYAALKATHIEDSLKHYMDLSYTWASDKDRIDSCSWTNDKLLVGTAWKASNNNGRGGFDEYDNVAYPEKRYFNYTAFLCPDSILKADYEIETLDDLRALARKLYEPIYPEDANVIDETDRRNYLNRFISYHILDRYGDYYGLTFYDGQSETSVRFDRIHYDVCDWYSTLMPYSLMKCSYPDGRTVGLYINRRGVRHSIDERGARVERTERYGVLQTGLNGIYQYIDRIVAYDETTQKMICNDRIRMDCTTLSPDFMTKLSDGEVARGHIGGNGDKYMTLDNYTTAKYNDNRSVAFKPGYVRNFEYGDDTYMHVRSRSMWYQSYEADEVLLRRRCDVKIKLPAVPAGKYELRLGTALGYSYRGVMNFYIDGQLVGENVDFRQDPSTPADQNGIGWISDEKLCGQYWETDTEVESGLKLKEDADADEAYTAFMNLLRGQENVDKESLMRYGPVKYFDKILREKGWMKGPKCYYPLKGSSVTAKNYVDTSLRDTSISLRKIIGTFETDGKSDHYLRVCNTLDGDYEFPLDYIELIPVELIETENVY